MICAIAPSQREHLLLLPAWLPASLFRKWPADAAGRGRLATSSKELGQPTPPNWLRTCSACLDMPLLDLANIPTNCSRSLGTKIRRSEVGSSLPTKCRGPIHFTSTGPVRDAAKTSSAEALATAFLSRLPSRAAHSNLILCQRSLELCHSHGHSDTGLPTGAALGNLFDVARLVAASVSSCQGRTRADLPPPLHLSTAPQLCELKALSSPSPVSSSFCRCVWKSAPSLQAPCHFFIPEDAAPVADDAF